MLWRRTRRYGFIILDFFHKCNINFHKKIKNRQKARKTDKSTSVSVCAGETNTAYSGKIEHIGVKNAISGI